jgi:hypothetical protein
VARRLFFEGIISALFASLEQQHAIPAEELLKIGIGLLLLKMDVSNTPLASNLLLNNFIL